MANKTELTVKERVRQAIKAKGMTQADLAAALGIVPSHLSDVLNGKTPSLHLAAGLQDLTGVPARDFIGTERSVAS